MMSLNVSNLNLGNRKPANGTRQSKDLLRNIKHVLSELSNRKMSFCHDTTRLIMQCYGEVENYLIHYFLFYRMKWLNDTATACEYLGEKFEPELCSQIASIGSDVAVSYMVKNRPSISKTSRLTQQFIVNYYMHNVILT